MKKFEYGEWANGRYEIPNSGEEQVLCIVNGKPTENVTLHGAYLLGNYFEGDGWCMEQYPDWESPEVVAWTPLPDTPYMEAHP